MTGIHESVTWLHCDLDFLNLESSITDEIAHGTEESEHSHTRVNLKPKRILKHTFGPRHVSRAFNHIASYADILWARQAIFVSLVGEEDCVTSLRNVCVGGY